MTTPFISRDDLSDYMAQDLSTSDVAGIAIDSACETLRTFADRDFNYVEDDVILLNGSGTDSLLLPEYPVVGTPVVEIDDEVSEDFVVEGSRLVRIDRAIWPLGKANIEVTYSHGYATSEAAVVANTGPDRVPSDLRAVALAIAAGLMSVSETRFHSISPRDTTGGSAPVEGPAPAVLTMQQEQTMKRYRRMQVG
jgi:hypothetical protein